MIGIVAVAAVLAGPFLLPQAALAAVSYTAPERSTDILLEGTWTPLNDREPLPVLHVTETYTPNHYRFEEPGWDATVDYDLTVLIDPGFADCFTSTVGGGSGETYSTCTPLPDTYTCDTPDECSTLSQSVAMLSPLFRRGSLSDDQQPLLGTVQGHNDDGFAFTFETWVWCHTHHGSEFCESSGRVAENAPAEAPVTFAVVTWNAGEVIDVQPLGQAELAVFVPPAPESTETVGRTRRDASRSGTSVTIRFQNAFHGRFVVTARRQGEIIKRHRLGHLDPGRHRGTIAVGNHATIRVLGRASGGGEQWSQPKRI